LSESEYDDEINNELEILERNVIGSQFEFPDVKNKEKKIVEDTIKDKDNGDGNDKELVLL
jgi:hypothetical protein